MREHEELCGDGHDDDCPICSGRMSEEFVARIEQAAAEPGIRMTVDEFTAWLDSL